MGAAWAQLGRLWCRMRHGNVMWPSHGRYECSSCGRRFRVCWEEALPIGDCVTQSEQPFAAGQASVASY